MLEDCVEYEKEDYVLACPSFSIPLYKHMCVCVRVRVGAAAVVLVVVGPPGCSSSVPQTYGACASNEFVAGGAVGARESVIRGDGLGVVALNGDTCRHMQCCALLLMEWRCTTT